MCIYQKRSLLVDAEIGLTPAATWVTAAPLRGLLGYGSLTVVSEYGSTEIVKLEPSTLVRLPLTLPSFCRTAWTDTRAFDDVVARIASWA
jgi:hypothetical protein